MTLAQLLVSLPRWQKRSISIFADSIALLIIGCLAVLLRFGMFFPIPSAYAHAIAVLPLLCIPVFVRFGLYRAVVRYVGNRFALAVFSAVSLSFLLWTTVIFILKLEFPRSALIIAWLMGVLYVIGSRFFMRWLLLSLDKEAQDAKAVIIYGAGESGRQLSRAMELVKTRKVVAFVDDDVNLQKHKIGAVKVYPPDDLPRLIEQLRVKEVLLAIPSLSASQRREVLNKLGLLPVHVATLPPIDQIVDGRVSFSDVRDVDIVDLLGRDVVPPKEALLAKCIKDQVVMVTGAGGSIGSELCRQIVNLQPAQLILFEISEFALYQIESELHGLLPNLVAILGSVSDEAKLKKIIQLYDVDTIYHAAAYKHVPIVEQNIEEGIRNNSFGTFTLARVAAENKVANFVLISTDKAVRPTNFMGASKRLAEMALQALQDEYKSTRFVIVRFGNVLGSSGSVIPLFRKQIAEGGPITVTHKEITRFFMTIPEAALLVIQAGSMGVGGDVFVLDMGEPVKIVDLARKMIRLSGLQVVNELGEGDIAIEFTGLRPGEKLYEELLIGDNVGGTEHPKIMKAHEEYLSYTELQQRFIDIDKALESFNYNDVRQVLCGMVSGFKHTSGIVDHLSD